MRYGIISDVHGNYEALQAIYKRLQIFGCDEIVCLGDIVGYGPCPGECIDFIREKGVTAIKGNHDHYINCPLESAERLEISEAALTAVRWTKDVLGDDHAAWLENLPFHHIGDDVTFIHAAIDTVDGEYWPYIFDVQSAMFHFYFQETRVAFFGHIHVPLLFACNGVGRNPNIYIEKLRPRNLLESPEQKFLINPGSVGQPRNADNRSCASVYDTVTGLVEPISVDYDVFATCKLILNAGLPEELAFRLIKGC